VWCAGNWFNITPDSNFKHYAVWMMILHNIQAWVLWVSALQPANAIERRYQHRVGNKQCWQPLAQAFDH
jgi:hypothetical protein